MKKCHFIGIGGIGMSGLALILLNRRVRVSGSDLASNPLIETLAHSGAEIQLSHSAAHITPDMMVIYNSDIKQDNPEFQAALQLKCQMMHRSELLQWLMQRQRSLAVAGTHGKTTTSSLLTWVLRQAGFDPSYAVGGIVPQLNGNAGAGVGDYFVAEACESDGSFLSYTPFGAIVTNIDLDHMDYYRTETALEDAFRYFLSRVSSHEHLFWCGDDRRLAQMTPERGISYGFGRECALRAEHFRQEGWSICFDIHFKGKRYPRVEAPLIGKHNALNVLAVFGMAISLSVEEPVIRDALRLFSGVGRRCEKKGEAYGILFLDDYGHHPTEIRATLQAIRQAVQDRRLVVAYQPHRYTRARECMGLYSHVFDEADELFVTEIYPAGESPIPGNSHEQLIAEIRQEKKACHFASRKEITQTLSGFLRPYDVLLTLGAGDITKGCPEVLALLKRKAPPKLKVGVVFGGASVEHEISLRSSLNICHSLNRNYYEIEHFGITREGQWVSGTQTREILERLLLEGRPLDRTSLLTHETLEKLRECDILFPVLHGPYGEDGTIQGFFEMLGKAYVGCDHRSSAICMDKVMTKQLMQLHGIRTSPFVNFSRYQWKTQKVLCLDCLHDTLSYPLFVKPIHLGSSIGVRRVERADEVIHAIEEAFRFDTDVLVEERLVGHELEFSVLGTDEILVFPPGEICTEGETYDYEGKYGEKGIPTKARAELPLDVIEEGKQFVEKVYRAVGCKGMARIDTFLDGHQRFWLNEINPIPGFTSISLYPQMCAANGLAIQELMDRLILLGLKRKREIDRLEKYCPPS
jgi:UDP-N-acetylmuramate--alanine ligase